LVATNYLNTIYTSTDYGASWTSQDSVRAWYEVTSDSTGQYLAAVVQNGYIYTSTNYGANWTQRDSARNWYDISSSSTGQYLAAVVNGGYIYTSSDYGANWTAQTQERLPQNSTTTYQAVAINATGNRITAGVNGGFLYSGMVSGCCSDTGVSCLVPLPDSTPCPTPYAYDDATDCQVIVP
jgi:photosystem II stability/assembly factor-like uncharacterized protein